MYYSRNCRCPHIAPTPWENTAVDALPANSTPSIKHSLFHRTTRTPLVVPPALWSLTHIDIFRVSACPTNPPAAVSLPSRHVVPPFDMVNNYVCAHKYGGAPPFSKVTRLKELERTHALTHFK